MVLPCKEFGSAHSAGLTLVLLHNFGGSGREWSLAAPLLTEHGRCIAIDLPGFGDAAEIPGYSVDGMTGQLIATLASLRLENYIVCGHSMSGKVAMVLAHQLGTARQSGESTDQWLPVPPRALILIAPSPLSPEPIAEEARARMLQHHNTPESAKQFVTDNSFAPLNALSRSIAEEDALRANPAAWQAWLECGTREDWSNRVESVSTPALVLVGAEDNSLGAEVQREKTLPYLTQGSMHVVANSGHLLPLEQPEALARSMAEFVRSLAL